MNRRYLLHVAPLTFVVGFMGACQSPEDLESESSAQEDQLAASGCRPVSTPAVRASGDDGNVAGNAIDGDLDTRWSQRGAGAWLEADLGAVKPVCGVRIAWYRGDARISRFEVRVSTDGVAYRTVLTGAASGKSAARETYAIDARARYIRIVGLGNDQNDWNSVTELQVLGSGTFDGGAPRSDAGVGEGGGSTSATRPGPGNTGVPAGTVLRSTGSLTVTQAGAVVEDVNVTGSINVKANNVTIRRFRLRATSFFGVRIFSGFTGTVIEDGDLDGAGVASAVVDGSDYVARRLNIHHTAGDGVKMSRGSRLERSWLHHLGMGDEAHADGVQISSGAQDVIQGNYFDMPVGVAGTRSNAAVFIKSDFGSIDDVVVEGNWMNGGNFTVFSVAGDSFGAPTRIRFTNNQFGRDYRYGIRRLEGAPTWQGNTWSDSGAAAP